MATLFPETITTNINHFVERAWLLSPLTTWLDLSSDRLFILTGAPGTGKSMISAWLAGQGTSTLDNASKAQLETLRSKVGAAHFCIAASGTTDPRNMATSMAEQLTQNIKGFSDALLKTLPEQIKIVVRQTVGTATDSSVTGVYIG